MRIDPTGMLDNPIYGEDGKFLGTDDRGLQGEAIVMSSDNFTQGMSHEQALEYGNTLSEACEMSCVSNGTYGSISSHSASLSSRPDYDGFVTVSEGVEWAKANPGALTNPTPDNSLYIDAAQLDFGNITADNFSAIGPITPINLLNKGNLKESANNTTLRATVYALGRVDMQMTRYPDQVRIINNAATDYDWNTGGSFLRNTLIRAERARTGLNDSHGFRAFYYGTGTLRRR